MSDTHRYSVSVAGAVIREDGRVLAVRRRDNGHWEPPGGVLEPSEPMMDGLAREVLEETGLIIEPNGLSGVYQNLKLDIVSLVFSCKATGGSLRPSDESTEFAWFSAA